MARPHDLYKAESQRAKEGLLEWNDDDDFRNPNSRRLSFFPKSEHGLLFSERGEERDKIDGSHGDFVTCASLELPLVLKERGIQLEKRIKTRVHCEIPPRAGNGKWSASLGGTSLVRGPFGCATGSMAASYHLNHLSRITGGMDVGDAAKLHIGASRSWDSSSSNLAMVLYTQPYEQCVGSSLTAQRTWNSLVETRLFLDCTSSFKSKGTVSISSLAVHTTQLDLGWRGKHPRIHLEIRPKLSQHLFGSLCCGWNDGLWKIGASLSQPLTSRVGSSLAMWPFKQTQKENGSLGLGVHYTKRGLAWVVSWSHGSINVRVPITIADRPLDVMYPVQALLLSTISTVIQAAIAKLWNSSTSNKDRGWNQQQQLLLQQGKAKRDAEQQKQLMVRQAAIRTKAEEKNSGLVILKAIYRVKGGDEWDVTTQLQFWTSDSTLELPASSKQHLLGFYDINLVEPDQHDDEYLGTSWWSLFWKSRHKTAEKKTRPIPTLTVKYQISGDTYQITVQDHEALVLPNARAITIDTVQ